MQTTHTRIYKDTLKELRILATEEDKKMMDMMQELIEFYKQSKEESKDVSAS